MPRPSKRDGQEREPDADPVDSHPLMRRFRLWLAVRERYVWEVSFEEKWGPILHGESDRVIGALDHHRQPSAHHHMPAQALAANMRWMQWEAAGEVADGRSPGRPKPAASMDAARRHLQKRYEDKGQRAAFLLANPNFVDDTMALAKAWGLETVYYEVQFVDLWTHRAHSLWCWQMLLTLQSVEDLPSLTVPPAEIPAVLEYLVDRNLDALSPQARELVLGLPISRFRQDVRDLTARYGLSALWERPIEGLLLSGHLYVPLTAGLSTSGAEGGSECSSRCSRRHARRTWRTCGRLWRTCSAPYPPIVPSDAEEEPSWSGTSTPRRRQPVEAASRRSLGRRTPTPWRIRRGRRD